LTKKTFANKTLQPQNLTNLNASKNTRHPTSIDGTNTSPIILLPGLKLWANLWAHRTHHGRQTHSSTEQTQFRDARALYRE
jgi:hypothetical protein